MKHLAFGLTGLAVVGLGAFWLLTAPRSLDADALSGLTPDLAQGEQAFWAAGCASCHAEEGATGDAKLALGGGQRFPSEFGTFVAPNISPSETHGIGAWTDYEILNAVTHGVSPDGAHYYPAFPYAAYGKADLQEMVSLVAYLRTLPEVSRPDAPHEVSFPFTLRRGIGLWKLAFVESDWMVPGDLGPEETRGRYLAEAMAHCGECHSPRNAMGGLDGSMWLAGAPNPSGQGTVPNITPGGLDWTDSDIAYYLESGFTPDFSPAGGHMTSVVENMGHLPAQDRAAIAAYLKAVPAVENTPESGS